MSKVLAVTAKHKTGLYSDTQESLKAEKVVDVTDDCPNADEKRRSVFLYTRANRERVVQMARPYEGEAYMGMHIHFFVDELDKVMTVAPKDDTFGSWASDLGLTKVQLRKLIEANAPD